ncbi:MAG: hypothetical protein KAW14_12225 [Candidatus Aegiribacteria sp.]|nr:hypothetical protein [Candidatus Aegiribacteria sp.]
MNPDELGAFWFTGEWGDEEVYSSQNDRSRWLRPVDGFRREIGVNPTGSESWFWQCYETSQACGFLELGYIGRISLHIGNNLSIPLEALDLANNDLDYDPTTIAIPRDQITGVFNDANTEDGPYNTEAWGTAYSYNRISEGVY